MSDDIGAKPTGVIPLADVCGPYFGLGYEEARRKAALHDLPVPAFRLSQSRKAPLVVAIADLRRLVDARAQEARDEWERMQA